MSRISKEFVMAGNATFTIELPAGSSQSHYTFKVQKVEAGDRWPEAWFVKMLTGPDNTSDYSYVGKLNPFLGQVLMTSASKNKSDSFPARLLNRVLARVWCDDHAAYEQHGYKTHHEGKCGRCGRKLTVPESIESGVGPECAKMMAV